MFKYTLEKRHTKSGWRWRIIHQNGNILANGGEGYRRPGDMNRIVGNMFRAIGAANYNVVEIGPKKKK